MRVDRFVSGNVRRANDSRIRRYAPASSEDGPPPRRDAYIGPRMTAEWDAAFAEMYANDPTFRDWRDAERGAELAAKTVATRAAIDGDAAAAWDEAAA